VNHDGRTILLQVAKELVIPPESKVAHVKRKMNKTAEIQALS
jgi:hypothetical protein